MSLTHVTAVVVDPAGNPYANASVNWAFVPNPLAAPGQLYTTGGTSPFQQFGSGDTDSFGNLSLFITDLATITPAGASWEFNVVSASGAIGFRLNTTLITGPTVDISAALQAVAAPLITQVAFGNITVTGLTDTGPLSVTGTSTLGNVNLGSANTLSTAAIKQLANNFFSILDGNGVSRFFLSNTSPYTNTFISAVTGGVVFLGGGAKTSVNNDTGQIVTASSIALQTTSQTLPATIVNDTLGGLLFTTNAGKGWQIANSTGQLQGFTGVTILLQGATSGGVTLAVPAVAGSNTITFPATTDTLVALALAQTLTNKRVTPRIVTMADATSVTPTSDTADENIFVSTQAGGTLTVNAPTGTPTDGQRLILRLKSTNAQTYSFNATYAFSASVVAPTTLAAGKTDYIGIIWNATNTKWDVVAVDQGH